MRVPTERDPEPTDPSSLAVMTKRDALHHRLSEKLAWYTANRPGYHMADVEIGDLKEILHWLRPRKRPSPRSITSPENSNGN